LFFLYILAQKKKKINLFESYLLWKKHIFLKFYRPKPKPNKVTQIKPD